MHFFLGNRKLVRADEESAATGLEGLAAAVDSGMSREDLSRTILQSEIAKGGAFKVIPSAIGDSRMANSFSSELSSTNQGVLTWLAFLSDNRVKVEYDYDLAVSGATLEEIAEQVPNLASLSPSPTICIINGGTNTFAVDYSETAADDAMTVMSGIISSVQSLGIIPVVEVDTPREEASWLAASGIASARYNRLLRTHCAENGIIIADHESSYIDSNGEPQEGYNIDDGIHQSATGAIVRANKVLGAISPLLPVYNDGVSSPRDMYDATLNPYGSIINGLMSGTGGSNLGAGASGDVADNWVNRVTSGTMTAVASKEEARIDGDVGAFQVVELNATDNATYRLYYSDVINTTNFDAGTKFKLSADFVIESCDGDIEDVRFILYDYDESSFGDIATAMKAAAENSGNKLPAVPLYKNIGGEVLYGELSGRVETEAITLSNGISSTQFLVRIESTLAAGASVTFKVGNVKLCAVE